MHVFLSGRPVTSLRHASLILRNFTSAYRTHIHICIYILIVLVSIPAASLGVWFTINIIKTTEAKGKPIRVSVSLLHAAPPGFAVGTCVV